MDMGIRPAHEVMKLSRLGASFQTRISFMRRLIRKMHKEDWRIDKKVFDLDSEGFGVALYVVSTPCRKYSLVCFSHYLDPEERTDRVIAESWDATFTLFDGIAQPRDIERLKQQTPKQELGRFEKTDLVLSRANKSLRLFQYVIDALSSGKQPGPEYINEVGYLMRTTAVYANGKFGLADRSVYAHRNELKDPYQAEMLTVYLIREFSHDLVEHVARCKGGGKFIDLDKSLKRHIGMGNATGLGMAPFLVDHPILIHKWFQAKERALEKVLSINNPEQSKVDKFYELVLRAKTHVTEWVVEDKQQRQKIETLISELTILIETIERRKIPNKGIISWRKFYHKFIKSFSVEGQEILLTLLLEPYPELVNDLSEGLGVNSQVEFEIDKTAEELINIISLQYSWALQYDFRNPMEIKHFWYYSEEKHEPRRGSRAKDKGADKEIQIAVAKDINDLYDLLNNVDKDMPLVHLMILYPEVRHTIHRIMRTKEFSYSDIQENIISQSCDPVDILRAKLAFFGATKFDPKSALWTRITLCQGAPLRNELSRSNADDWCFPTQPVIH